jgi:hypothetical protein
MLLLSNIWLVLLLLHRGQASPELAQTYYEVFASYDVYPPLTPNSTIWQTNATRPVEVVIGSIFVSVDTIDPGNSEFTVTSRR